MSSKPLFVAISDIHFNLQTLPLASQALRAALAKAEELNVPLVIAGDLHDTKANIRGEVQNELLSILQHPEVTVYVLPGNHDLLNEKAPEHGLNYLEPHCTVFSGQAKILLNKVIIGFIPYTSNPQAIRAKLTNEQIVVMHQGFLGAHLGDYVQDKTSMDPETLKDFTVISGHYHRHQTVGPVTYIGNPFTLTFGEANDGPKGFLVVNEDGSFTRDILPFRKHVILETHVDVLNELPRVNPEDLLWLKVKGPRIALKALNKQSIGERLLGHSNFKLDLIYDDIEHVKLVESNLSGADILDSIIEESGENVDALKALWRSLETQKG